MTLRNMHTQRPSGTYIEDSLPKPGPSEPVTYLLDDLQTDEPHSPRKTMTIEEPTETDMDETNNTELAHTDEMDNDEPTQIDGDNPTQMNETRRPQLSARRPARYC